MIYFSVSFTSSKFGEAMVLLLSSWITEQGVQGLSLCVATTISEIRYFLPDSMGGPYDFKDRVFPA